MTAITIEKDYLRVDGTRYLREKSGNLELGSFGLRKGDAAQRLVDLEIDGHLRCKYLHDDVLTVTAWPFDWATQRREELDAQDSVKYFVLDSKAAVAGTYTDMEKAGLALVKVEIPGDTLKRILNHEDEEAREYLRKEGKDARVVAEVWTFMESQMAETLAAADTYEVNAAPDNAGLELGVRDGAQDGESVVFSTGTIFAFSMHAVRQWNESGVQVVDLAEDRVGLD